MRCDTCGRVLTLVEFTYYDTRCEGCEGEWFDAIEHWRHGGRNDYFDQQFGKGQSMENQHKHIKGYRDLSEEEIALMNAIKQQGERLEATLTAVHIHLDAQSMGANASEAVRIQQTEPRRWASIARTHFQEGLMALTRAVAQPGSF